MDMLYRSKGKEFSHHVHQSLRRRIRIFLIISAIMLVVALGDIFNGTLSLGVALLSIIVGGGIGFFTSRIFHLSWQKDGELVVSRIDKIGVIVLILYIAFEIARAYVFQSVIVLSSSAAAVTYVFVASALISRVVGLRGRVLKILNENDVFGQI
jgi:hypothetical protein